MILLKLNDFVKIKKLITKKFKFFYVKNHFDDKKKHGFAIKKGTHD